VAALVGLTVVAVEAKPSSASVLWQTLENGKGTTDASPVRLSATAGFAGAAVWVRTFTGDQDQMWDFEMQRDGSYIIRSGYTSHWFALSILNNSSANGTHVIQWWYEPTNAYQKWKLEFVLGQERYRNVATQKCLAVTGGTASNYPNSGAQVIIWSCGTGLDQLWKSDVAR
jgi:hypothetical protein